MKLKHCPACGAYLEEEKGRYICSNKSCGIFIMDNHIFEMQSFIQMITENNQEENNQEEQEQSEEEQDNHKKVLVMNQDQVESYALQAHDEESIVISISSIGSMGAFLVKNNVSKIQEVIGIQFNDEEKDDTNFGSITYQEALTIANFVKKYEHDGSIKSIIVSCEDGRSRSAGVAAAIVEYMYKDTKQILENEAYTPNLLCYKKVLKALVQLT